MEVSPIDIGHTSDEHELRSNLRESSNEPVHTEEIEDNNKEKKSEREEPGQEQGNDQEEEYDPEFEHEIEHTEDNPESEHEKVDTADDPNEQKSDNQEKEDDDHDDEYEPEGDQDSSKAPPETANVGVNDSNDDDDDDDDEYDPESAYEEISVMKAAGVSPSLQNDSLIEKPEEEDEYDPEVPLNDPDPHQREDYGYEPKPKASNIIKGKLPAGLPPKPPVNAAERSTAKKDPQQQLKEAYDAIMQSEIVKDPNFVNLPQTEQMKLIMEQLSQRNVNLSGTAIASNPSNVNYDQVYSYNKPFKNLKNPIPLVPVNEFCRRPNITAPMTPEEEKAYDDFIKREAYYMNLQNWDEFPDKLRLFIGNLPANTISKQDLFRIFSQYGDVIQIAIKAGYGFTQFRTTEACLECIKGESNVPLHNKIMRLDASRPQKSRRPGKPEINNPNLASRGRDRSPEESSSKRGRDEQTPGNRYGYGENKKQKSVAPDCQVYITGKSSVFFIRKVKKAFSSSQVSIEVEDITHRDINDVISEAAYSGVLGTCVIKEAKVDVQTFENTSDGGIKFDEYADIDPEIAADILSKAKFKKYGNTASPQPYVYGIQNQNQNQNKSYVAAMNNDFYDTGYGGNRRSGGRNDQHDNRGRNDQHDNRGRSGRNERGRGKGGRSNNNNNWESHHGNNNMYSQNVPYGQPPAPNYGSPQPAYNQPPATQADPNSQANLIQTLQGMDPASMQNMIALLQQQQQQQQHQRRPQSIQSMGMGQPMTQSPYGYNQPLNYGQAVPHPPPPQSHTQAPSGQVNSLLSQLQSSLSSGYNPQQQSQPANSTQSLMETLARLSRK